jgi:hypothetical protein
MTKVRSHYLVAIVCYIQYSFISNCSQSGGSVDAPVQDSTPTWSVYTAENTSPPHRCFDRCMG